MADRKLETEAVLRRVEETLQMARHGFEDLIGTNRTRRFSGLRNLIVFGRSVTFVRQNLCSAIPKGEFDRWYEPKQEEMKKDPDAVTAKSSRQALFSRCKAAVSVDLDVGAVVSEAFDPGDIRLGVLVPIQIWSGPRSDRARFYNAVQGYLRTEFGLEAARAADLAAQLTAR